MALTVPTRHFPYYLFLRSRLFLRFCRRGSIRPLGTQLASTHEDGNGSRHDQGDPGGGSGVAEFVEDGLEDGEAGVDDSEESFEACEEGEEGEDLLSVCAVVPLGAFGVSVASSG